MMIKIDGEKIKQLREAQGLTQLYMATAVDVTTDTISRWENKRYPNIKKENAEKLAEALGVNVEDILLEEESPPDDHGSPLPSSELQSTAPVKRGPLHFVLFLMTFVVVILVSVYFGNRLLSTTPATTISAVRIMPPRTIPGSTFPVVIEVSQSSDRPISIILKETLPDNCEVVQVSPSEGASVGNGEIKWLDKLETTTRYSYLARLQGGNGNSYAFSGTVTTASTENSIDIAGKNTIETGPHHWADLDSDGTISDQEILTVFDYYSGIDDSAIDIEFIEKMWLGSGYSWDSDKDLITIMP